MFFKESTVPENLLVNIRTFCGMLLPDLPTTECSNVVYMSVVDLHADSVALYLNYIKNMALVNLFITLC